MVKKRFSGDGSSSAPPTNATSTHTNTELRCTTRRKYTGHMRSLAPAELDTLANTRCHRMAASERTHQLKNSTSRALCFRSSDRRMLRCRKVICSITCRKCVCMWSAGDLCGDHDNDDDDDNNHNNDDDDDDHHRNGDNEDADGDDHDKLGDDNDNDIDNDATKQASLKHGDSENVHPE
jgi:hypothetical protein